LENKDLKIDKKPNIFIFICEAFRKDHITDELTPNLEKFKKKNYFINNSYSSANATQHSWFSIFHSNNSISYSGNFNDYKKGSIPLNILKKMGYKINIYASCETKFYHMDEVLFGKDHFLIDKFNNLFHTSKIAAIRDKNTVSLLSKDLAKKEFNNSNIFIIFLDSTHSEYSWGKEYKAKHFPVVDTINYLSLSFNKSNLYKLQNRYKNAVGYIDHLFNEAINSMEKNNLLKDSIIVFTSDHGEEFYEEKSIFHGSQLNEYQLSVPIIYKLNSDKKLNANISSHIDIFPTILDTLSNKETFDDLFDGKSIFSKHRKNYVISANQNGSYTPNEIIFHFDDLKMKGKITSQKNKCIFELNDFESYSRDKFINYLNL
ncbi:MAG: hypothetical protein K1060chlam5_00664, partial [Candidatus Anoxychlamydiales bacterium]|nr:hypothetical protein [Candidatus Anoxychlamydiales bacterium]